MDICTVCGSARKSADLIPTYTGEHVCRTRFGQCAVTLAASYDRAGWPEPLESGAGDPRPCGITLAVTGAIPPKKQSPEPVETVPGSVALRRQFARHGRRRSRWVDPARSLGDQLAELPAGVDRVYVAGGTPIGGWQAWADSDGLPDGWGERGRYADTARPVFRLTDPTGRKVDVLTAAQWFGPQATGAQCAAASVDLGRVIGQAFTGGQLLSTPTNTGRDLIRRALPPGDWPVLADEHQRIIRSASGQGRIETLPVEGDTIPGLAVYDARVAYSALVWSLGRGPAIHDGRPEVVPYGRGWYRCRWSAPAGWDHVGILPEKHDDVGAGWHYPTVGAGWCEAVEVELALARGWTVDVEERLLLVDPTADPLRKWSERLTAAYTAAESPLVRAGLRAILLHAIGGLHGRPGRITRRTEEASAHTIPEGATIERMDGHHVIWSAESRTPWPEMSHPEWSSAVWARARRRLLLAPGEVGALTIPRADVLGFRTDAIYTTRPIPEWDAVDDGRPGRYRRQDTLSGPLPAPRRPLDLLRLRQVEVAA